MIRLLFYEGHIWNLALRLKREQEHFRAMLYDDEMNVQLEISFTFNWVKICAARSKFHSLSCRHLWREWIENIYQLNQVILGE